MLKANPGGTGVGWRFRVGHVMLALAPVLATFLAQWMAWPFIRPYAWFLFSPAVFLSAWIGGRRLGIFASIVATLLVTYFFLPPERTLEFERPIGEVSSALTFLGTGIIFSLFHGRLKRAERGIAEAQAASRFQAQLESVFHAIQDGIAVFDMEGTVILVNEAEARINGFSSTEALKRHLTFFQDLYELSYPDGKPLPFEEWPISKVLKGESITNLELCARRRDTGQQWFFSFR
jgi:PAS domain-containing protein